MKIGDRVAVVTNAIRGRIHAIGERWAVIVRDEGMPNGPPMLVGVKQLKLEEDKKPEPPKEDPVMTDLKDRISKWGTSSVTLREGDNNDGVGLLQEALEAISPDLYSGEVDSDYGKLTVIAVQRFQQHRLLYEDGISGPITKGHITTAVFKDWHPGHPFLHAKHDTQVLGPYHPELGYLPDTSLGMLEEGKVSWFGGPQDRGDRIYGQAYVDGNNYSGSVMTPAQALERHSKLVEMGVLRSAEEALKVVDKRTDKLFFKGTLDEWPITTDWENRTKRAGLSSLLNEYSWYIAMRWHSGPGKYRNENGPKLLVWSEATGKACIVMRTDWGPARSTGKLLDLSKGTIEYLELETGHQAHVCWAPDDAPLGPVTP